MKKVLSLLVIGGIATLMACGPSAEEKAAAEKKKADSIAREAAIADSIAQEKQKLFDDSVAQAQKIADSIAALAAKKTTKPGTTPVTKPGTVKPGTRPGATKS